MGVQRGILIVTSQFRRKGNFILKSFMQSTVHEELKGLE